MSMIPLNDQLTASLLITQHPQGWVRIRLAGGVIETLYHTDCLFYANPPSRGEVLRAFLTMVAEEEYIVELYLDTLCQQKCTSCGLVIP